jgi:hypothetical protein
VRYWVDARLAIALLAGVAVGFGGGWLAFGAGGGSSDITRAQAEQAVIREGEFQTVACEAAGGGEFSCKAFERDCDSHLKQTATVRVFARNGRPIVDLARERR